MWWIAAAAWAGPAITLSADSAWPTERRAPLDRALGQCAAQHPWVGELTVSTESAEVGFVGKASTNPYGEPNAFSTCLEAALTAQPELKAAEESWWATVTVGLDPKWLAPVTVHGVPPELEAAVRTRVALCAATKGNFAGSVAFEVEKGEPSPIAEGPRMSYARVDATPATKVGNDIATCVFGDDAGKVGKSFRGWARIDTATPPARGPVTVTAVSEASPAVLAVLKDVAGQCVAETPLKKPFDLALTRNADGSCNAAAVSMAEGQEQPASELGMCVMFGKYPELPVGSYQFTLAPQ